MLIADDNQPLSEEALAEINTWLDRWWAEADGRIRNRVFFLSVPVETFILCGAWALDRHNNTRYCELEAGHAGPHFSRAWPYHMNWTGVGTEAKEVEDSQGKVEH